jgi:hypothetical protein
MKVISDVVPIFTHNDRSATNLLKLKVGQQYIWESSSGKFWHLRADPKDILHREDGPAIEYRDGSKKWFLNGKHHRVDGPAIEGADGTKIWMKNDRRHRIDGPAAEFGNGDQTWWLDDKWLPYEEFSELIKEVKDLPPELKLTDPRWWVREMK